MDFFTYWNRAAAANMSLAGSAVRMAEVLVATLTVLRVRGDLINAGFKSPLETDWKEMSMMVTEKLSAFGKSGSATNREFEGVQAKLFADWQQAAMLPLSSASPPAAFDFGTRLATLGLDMLELSARLAQVAIDPVHRTVTANAKRLG